jgi:hypothetical protein
MEKLHNEELHKLFLFQNIIGQIKSSIRWAGHVAHMGEEKCAQGYGGKARIKETTQNATTGESLTKSSH